MTKIDLLKKIDVSTRKRRKIDKKMKFDKKSTMTQFCRFFKNFS